MTTTVIMRSALRFSFVLVLILLSLVVIPTSASPVPGNNMITQGIAPDITNLSSVREGGAGEFTVTPTPIDLLRVELDQETLPGPRYMAFGPSAIGISIDPRVLAVCFAVTLIVLVIWFVSFRNRNTDRED